ncbi:MAG: TonB-dependent receptor plug domain-containing protein, partial [Leptospira sp.]|nr:TonB-dependent receptor plug domain-containing protein [Leptospira sp.]
MLRRLFMWYENAMLGGSVRFPLANIERIEVVSGPASALYGANAFNGIINIITKDGETNPGNHIDATYGTYEKKYTNPGASASFSARGTSGGENPIQYSVGGYYYKTDGPNFGGIQGLDPPNNGATKANPNYNYHYDPVYYYGRKACGDSTCKPDSKSIGYFWSPGYNVSQEETYNVTAKFSRGGFRFETINWQYLQGEGIFGNGTQQIDTKERGFESGKYDSRNLALAYG